MGDFTTVDQVKSLFRRIKIEADTGDEKTNTVLTIEEVDQFITETELLVKSRLATCYAVTSIGAESTIIIGTVVKYLVADIIVNVMALTTNVNSERKNQDMGPSWSKKAKDLMDKICPMVGKDVIKVKPSMPLPDTPLLSEPPTGASLFESSVNIPVFTKNGNNW